MQVQESITLMELPKLSPEQICKDTEEGEHVLGISMPQGDIIITEAESLVTKENNEAIMDLKEQEKTGKLEEVLSDLALKVDKEKVMDEKKEADDVAGGQNMERGLELNESEAELVDQNIAYETEEKLVESPSEETRKTLDEMIQEEVAPHQEAEERVSVPESSEVKEKAKEERSLDLTPLQEESCLPTEQDEEEIKEQIHKHEPANEAVKSDEVIQVSYASPEGETVVEATKNEEQVVADKIQSILETVETVDTEPVKSNEDDIAESLNSVNFFGLYIIPRVSASSSYQQELIKGTLTQAGEEIQTMSKDGENVQIDETAETSVNGTEDEHNATVLEEGISKNKESIVPETASEEIKNSDEAEENSHKEKEEVIYLSSLVRKNYVSDMIINYLSLFACRCKKVRIFCYKKRTLNQNLQRILWNMHMCW